MTTAMMNRAKRSVVLALVTVLMACVALNRADGREQ